MADQGDVIRVMIVDDIADTREQLEKLLFFEKDIQVVAKAATGREAVAMAKQHTPDVVLMDINMPDMDGITATEQILNQVPSIEVIMMSVQGEQDYLRRAMLAGAREFLIKPISAEELYNSIRHVHRLQSTKKRFVSTPAALDAMNGGEAGTRGQLIAVFSPKGGVGVSTIAANLAVALRQVSGGKKVALVDGNLSFGDVGVIMNLVSNKTIADLASHISELDRDLLADVMATHASQVRVLLAPPNPQTGELVTADHLRTILDLMRKEFDYVVVDTQSSFQDRALAALDTADRIITLMTLEMTSIKNIKLFLEVAELLEYPKEKMLLVLNKAEGGMGIKAEDVEANIQHKVTLQIGNAPQEFALSVNRGVPLVIEKRNHRASEDIFRLAALLNNNAKPADSAGKKDEKAAPAGRTGLFGRLMTKR